MKIQFYLRYHTEFGQNLGIRSDYFKKSGTGFLAMKYIHEELWMAEAEIELKTKETLIYNYFLENKEGEITEEWGNDRVISAQKKPVENIVTIDTWNFAGEYENVFFTAPFQEILLKSGQ